MRGLSLRTKVFFLFAGAALLIVVPTLLLIGRAVEQRVYQRATDELSGSAAPLQSNWALRDSLLRQEARLRADERELERAWLAGDTRRMRRILLRALEPDLVVLAADTSGETLVRAGAAIAREVLLEQGRQGIVSTLHDSVGAPIRLAIWPVVTDSGLVGVVGVGAKFTPELVADLKKSLIGGADLALVVGDSLVASTLADSLKADLSAHGLPELLRASATARQHELAGQPYLTSAVRLPTYRIPVTVLLFRPIADELRVARGIYGSLILIGVAALALALLLAGVVSRIVARPAQALAAAAAELARGQFDAPLPRPSSDEIGRLAVVFGEMRAAIAEREARLRSAQAELIHREKLAAMGRLVAQLSHEINNPIYNIQNCLEALARRGDPRDPNREFLELAQEELQRMAVLTRQMLDQSRPLADAATAADLNALATRVLTLAERRLAGQGVRLETALDPALPSVVLHPDAIQQVLTNLVENALDAMPAGGTLRVGTAAEPEEVVLWVEDTGAGIEAEHLPHIFEAFYTTKPGLHGVGLGLFVSEGIVRGHRGRLAVASQPGVGSRFLVRLPRETLAPARAAAEVDGPRSEDAAASHLLPRVA